MNQKIATIFGGSGFIGRHLIRRLTKLDYLIIDCLWYKKHPAHFNLEQVLDLNRVLSPKKTILTNMHTDLDYNQLKKKFPKNIVPGYDGMTVNLQY